MFLFLCPTSFLKKQDSTNNKKLIQILKTEIVFPNDTASGKVVRVSTVGTQLRLNWNEITIIPPEIAQLTNLTELDLHGNEITIIPPEI